MQAQPPSVATRNGVIAGLVLGILSLPVITLSAVGRLAGLRGGLLELFLIAALIVFAMAGFAATRRNGLIRSGAWAGFLAGLITAFIAICLGVVILTLLAPYALLVAAHAPLARRAGRAVTTVAARTVIVRLFLGGLILAVSGVVAGLIGGLLGRLGRRGDAGGHGAPYAASPVAPQGYAPPPPPPPAQAYAGVYTPAPQVNPTPTPYYPTAMAYDDSAPTTIRDSQA